VTIVINGFIYGAVAATLSAITMALKSPHAAYNAKMVSAPPIVLPFLCREPVLANHRLVFTTATGKLRQPARNNKPEASQTVPFPVFCFVATCCRMPSKSGQCENDNGFPCFSVYFFMKTNQFVRQDRLRTQTHESSQNTPQAKRGRAFCV
jgi:hypothetical protein